MLQLPVITGRLDGICMIRFQDLRPRGIPSGFGVDSENAAHRIAVTRTAGDARKEGVFIPQFSPSSIFSSLDEASTFFAAGAVGYSPARDKSHFQGMELRLLEWQISPLRINKAFVRLYEDGKTFPKGGVQLDSAMVMRRLKHEWHRIPTISSPHLSPS